MSLQVQTLKLPDTLREGTRTFVEQNEEALALHLERVTDKLQRQVRNLKGRDGLLIKRNFHQSTAA